ncbi:MAG: hypothetical protein R8F89_03655 [Roseobacter sp.]|nr:hypothetical protein [Roseobacter sp.]
MSITLYIRVQIGEEDGRSSHTLIASFYELKKGTASRTLSGLARLRGSRRKRQWGFRTNMDDICRASGVVIAETLLSTTIRPCCRPILRQTEALNPLNLMLHFVRISAM